MSARKKLVMSISMLCLVFVLALVAVGAVLASTQQTLQSSISVTYVAQNVSAKVKANYIIGNTSTPMIGDSGNELVFTPTSVEGGSLAPEGDILLENNTKVIFEYIFTNTSTTFNIALNLFSSPTDNNMNVTYIYSDNQITNYSSLIGDANHTPFAEQRINANDNANSTKYVYIVVEVNNLADNASFEGEYIWKMDKADAEV